MPQKLSDKAKLLSNQKTVEPQIILEIDGIPFKFGALEISKLARIGQDGLLIGGFIIGGTIKDPTSKAYISLDKTSKSIASQIFQDKGGSGSISGVTIELVDKNNEVSKIFQPNNYVADVLSSKATVYWSFKNGSHPEDSIPIFYGIVDKIEFPAATCRISIAHPDALKNVDVFNVSDTKLTAAIDDTTTTIPLEFVSDITLGADIHESLITIKDEIILVGTISGFNLIGCTRGYLATTAIAHDDASSVKIANRFTERPNQLALKLMLSGAPEFFVENKEIVRFKKTITGNVIPNSIFLGIANYLSSVNATVGDFVSITGSSIPANNVVNSVITSIGLADDGDYFTLSDTIIEDLGTTATFTVKSRYNVLNDGLMMTPDQVDVLGHEEIEDLFFSNFPEYDFKIGQSINGLSFLDNEIYKPVGLYSLPRAGRASVGYTHAPLAIREIKTIDNDVIENPEQLTISRSINKNFYNSTVWKYNHDLITDKFLAGEIILDADSQNRIGVGNKPLKIETKGLVDSIDITTFIHNQSVRILERYKFAAQTIKNVRILFKAGFNLEIGDIISFGDERSQLHNVKLGNRTFETRLMEITNRDVNLTTGEIKISLLDTSFGNDGTFFVISPSSIIDAGSTTTSIKLKNSFGTSETELEIAKWDKYLNKRVMIHNEDWSYVRVTKFKEFDPSSLSKIIVEELDIAPSEGFTLELPQYDDADDLVKIQHGFFNPEINVTGGTSQTVFTVDDSSNIFVDSIIVIHSRDWATESKEVIVIDITGLTITVNLDLGFTPVNGLFIGLVGFKTDLRVPYRIL